ncbi:hypothetical protein H4R20_007318, partial [Coemansia guatemalensis]
NEHIMYLKAETFNTTDEGGARPTKTELQYCSGQNPWASLPCDNSTRPWSQALRRLASRQRVEHDPLLNPSAAHIGALARAISRRAAHGMAESLGDAVASPLPRSETHMVGVMSDGDVADQTRTPSTTLVAAGLSGERNIAAGVPSNAARLNGLAITECMGGCQSVIYRQDVFTPEHLLVPSDECTANDVCIASRSLVNVTGDSALAVDKHLSTQLRSDAWPSLGQVQSSPSSISSLLSQPTIRTVKMIRHKVQNTDTLEGVSVHYGIS